MPSTTRLRPSVLEARHRLLEGREKLRQRHQRGSPGVQVCAALADLLDTIVLDLYEAALVDLGEHGSDGLRSQVTLVPNGGYGRRDVAPYSDVDLMILHAPSVTKRVNPLASRLVRDLCDAGLSVGQSVRTPRIACQWARHDPKIWTSLVESRYLTGSVRLFTRFANMFQHQARRRTRAVCASIDRARAEERAQSGETVYLLQPNIKRTRGGLREIHLLRWTGFARYGTADPDSLQLHGALSPADLRTIQRAAAFLLRLRNELHFHAGKSQDVLDRAEQVRIAAAFGYQGEGVLLPVEQFMREYFRWTDELSHLVAHFVARARPGSRWAAWLAPLVSLQVEGDFRVGPSHISTTRRGREKLDGNLCEILRLADLASSYDKAILPATRDAVRSAVADLSAEIPPEAVRRFLSLLSRPARLGELLRLLHETRILEKLVPAFAHARWLLQFNNYHQYTVDEHCLRAVEQATAFRFDRGLLGKVYRGIERKGLLHLALLIHDAGKGFTEDHSEVGLRIAGETAARLGLSQSDSEALKFLVHKHLLMSHLAFRRDTSDEQTIVRFAVEVGSPDVLSMLYVLTAADFAAVGPGVFNEWKSEVLADLYSRAMEHLAGDRSATSRDERSERRRAEIRNCLGDDAHVHWFAEQVASLPNTYLTSRPPVQIAAELRQLNALPHGEVIAYGRYIPESATVEFVVRTHEDITPGVFHKLTGALASHGLEILSAEINTLSGALVLDRFFVNDPDFTGEPPESRVQGVCHSLVESLRAHDGVPPKFRRVWRVASQRQWTKLAPLPTQVRTDNSTSERFTIIDVFAADRSGLLYTISRTLFEQGLSVSLAKIGTYLDQVVDVFFVTDGQGQKIKDENFLRHIQERVLEAIESLEHQDVHRATSA